MSIIEYLGPGIPTANVDKAEHNILDDVVLKMVLQEIQNFRKDIQQWRTEQIDLIHKVDHM